MSLKNLSEKERNFILANAKGVRSIKYEHYLIKKKAKENVKKKIKDNSELPGDNSTSTGGGGGYRRSWRHYYGRVRGGGGGRVSMPDTLSLAKEKITDVTYRSPLSLTVEQPSKKSNLRKIMKAYRNNFSKYKL